MQIITDSLASARRKPADQQCDCLSALSCQPCTPSIGGGSSSPSGLTGPQSEAVQRRSQGGPEHAFSLLGLRDSSQRGASTEQRTSRFIVPWVPHRAEHCNDTEPTPGLRSRAQEGQAEVFSSCCGQGKGPGRGREKGVKAVLASPGHSWAGLPQHSPEGSTKHLSFSSRPQPILGCKAPLPPTSDHSESSH